MLGGFSQSSSSGITLKKLQEKIGEGVIDLEESVKRDLGFRV